MSAHWRVTLVVLVTITICLYSDSGFEKGSHLCMRITDVSGPLFAVGPQLLIKQNSEIYFFSQSVEVYQLVNSKKFPYRLNFFLDIVMSQLKLKYRCILTLFIFTLLKIEFSNVVVREYLSQVLGAGYLSNATFGIHCVQMFWVCNTERCSGESRLCSPLN